MRGGIDLDAALHRGDLGVVLGEALLHVLRERIDLLLLLLVVGAQFGDRGIVIGLLHVVRATAERDRGDHQRPRGPPECRIDHVRLLLHERALGGCLPFGQPPTVSAQSLGP